tara:strand:- start:8708 stop:8824 length:117 start_codon:yes stop_codon:yes gene_type:complete
LRLDAALAATLREGRSADFVAPQPTFASLALVEKPIFL